ncbi:hypothetical protein MNEG_10264 [Monoraphidium neglectum]|uniref:Uncharacterized protein n=1 Tax=Monoraphidium neglectum TaxID=145388 RepID=A0A0D2M9P9_9CHLO|nr:hypothetical protein MNEG_10264 [Monoraphidium neglectum]KIY97696.1 hypothetical protein MNEG_10264 [Monoraphidium neglectum]|eukprot:XP_013896716.1 hypothetical protein MNEG_10264 [Monoraphidium neglectum]
MESVFTALLLAIEIKRLQAARAEAAAGGGSGYQPLASDDVEARGEDGKEERTWAALFVDACKYAWPEAMGLRLRVLGCVAMIIFMRFLNLAVPIFYKVRARR